MEIVDEASNLYNNLLNEAKGIKSNGANQSVVDKAIANTTKLTKVIKNSVNGYDTTNYSVDVDNTIDTLNDIKVNLKSDDIDAEGIISDLFCTVGNYIDALQRIEDGVKPDTL